MSVQTRLEQRQLFLKEKKKKFLSKKDSRKCCIDLNHQIHVNAQEIVNSSV